jgi:hypothetical protein
MKKLVFTFLILLSFNCYSQFNVKIKMKGEDSIFVNSRILPAKTTLVRMTGEIYIATKCSDIRHIIKLPESGMDSIDLRIPKNYPSSIMVFYYDCDGVLRLKIQNIWEYVEDPSG